MAWSDEARKAANDARAQSKWSGQARAAATAARGSGKGWGQGARDAAAAARVAAAKPNNPVVARHDGAKSVGTDHQQPRDGRGRFAPSPTKH